MLVKNVIRISWIFAVASQMERPASIAIIFSFAYFVLRHLLSFLLASNFNFTSRLSSVHCVYLCHWQSTLNVTLDGFCFFFFPFSCLRLNFPQNFHFLFSLLSHSLLCVHTAIIVAARGRWKLLAASVVIEFEVCLCVLFFLIRSLQFHSNRFNCVCAHKNALAWKINTKWWRTRVRVYVMNSWNNNTVNIRQIENRRRHQKRWRRTLKIDLNFEEENQEKKSICRNFVGWKFQCAKSMIESVENVIIWTSEFYVFFWLC